MVVNGDSIISYRERKDKSDNKEKEYEDKNKGESKSVRENNIENIDYISVKGRHNKETNNGNNMYY